MDLKFGSLEGDDPNLIFGDIRGIQVASDGTIYVLDFQAAEVRVFDSDGQYLRTIARRGEGPGEITEANGIILSGDTLLWIHDHGKWTIIGVDLAGEEVRRFNKPVMSYTYIWNGVFDNRGRYWRRTSHSDDGETYPPPPGLSSGTYRRYHKSYDLSSGAVDSVYLGESSGRSYTYQDSNGLWQFLPLRFEASEMIVFNPSGGYWRANSASYRIARTSEGRDTLVVIEAGLPVQPVTDEDRSEYVESILESRPGIRREAERGRGPHAGRQAHSGGHVRGRRRPALGTEGHSERRARLLRPVFRRRRLPGLDTPRVQAARGRFWVQHGNIYTWVTDEMGVPYIVRAPFS